MVNRYRPMHLIPPITRMTRIPASCCLDRTVGREKPGVNRKTPCNMSQRGSILILNYENRGFFVTLAILRADAVCHSKTYLLQRLDFIGGNPRKILRHWG